MQDYTMFRGLPVSGVNRLKDGIHSMPMLIDPITKTTTAPAYVEVQDGEIVAYGMQPHVMIWRK